MKNIENETVTHVNDNISLIQNPKGLTFGTDALLLAAFVRESKKSAAAELGSGSGIISLLLAGRNKLKNITAIELLPDYADITKRNIELNGMTDRITPLCADVRDCPIRELDVIFSNPPYMKADSGKINPDPGKYAARHEVNGTIGELCGAAAKMLKYGGLFYCVYRPDRLADLIYALKKAKLEPKRLLFVCQDTLHAPCLVLTESKLGASSPAKVVKPLYLYKDGGKEMTEELKYIYENGNMPDSLMK